jgi:hypothetical protein
VVRLAAAARLDALCDLAGAVRTTCSGSIDRHSTELAILCHRRRRSGLFDELRDSPDDKCDEEEVDSDTYEVTDAEFYGAYAPGGFLPVSGWCYRSDEGHYEVIDNCLNDFPDCTAKHDCNSECDEVVLHQKISEIPQHSRSLEKCPIDSIAVNER